MLPDVLPSVDLPAWLAWSLAGLSLFSPPELPPLRTATAEARRVLLVLALDRTTGNISRSAALLGISRHALRGHLDAAGLARPPAHRR
jgi:DNA-binding NtrC family response regulator